MFHIHLKLGLMPIFRAGLGEWNTVLDAFNESSGSVTFWYGSGSGSLDTYTCFTGPDPTLLDNDFQDANKNKFF
jgi:hypothetical protein